jgi:hypothetical protein
MSKTEKQEAVKANEPIKQEGGDMKVKLPKFKTSKIDDVVKVDLSKPPKTETEKIEEQVEQVKQEDDAIPIGETKKVDVGEQTGDSTKVDKQVQESSEDAKTEESPLQEITEEEVIAEEKPQTVVEDPNTVILPESVQKLIDFMDDTGGTVEDYVRLNADYSTINDAALLKEYYKKTRPHLDDSEISFLMEDNFSYDEEVDEERHVRKQKLAHKEEIAKAKNFLEGLKDKYYEDIKLRPSISNDQRKATDFFNRYNEREEVAQKQHKEFVDTTNKLLNDEFKGFDFNVGEKKFRYGVKDPSKVAESQSNINTFVRKFLNKKGEVADYKGYHKAMYAAENADTIAQHFYDQGKADATKNIMAESKNIDQKPRANAQDVYVGGLKVRAVTDGTNLTKLRIKQPKFNKNN